MYEKGSSKNESLIKQEIRKIVEAQAFLLTAIVSADVSKILQKAYAFVSIYLFMYLQIVVEIFDVFVCL